MFTQKLSMDCTREQYEKHLRYDLLKMGYKEGIFSKIINGVIVNNFKGENGLIAIGARELSFNISRHNRTNLVKFNAPLFLALAAMTDKKYGGYGEYWVFKGKDCAPEFISGNIYKAITPINKVWCFIDEMGDENGFSENEKYFRKATVSEIMQKFGDGFGEKFGEPKKDGKTINIEISCDFTVLDEEISKLHCIYTKLIKGEYYYCEVKSTNKQWVFISSGESPLTSCLACLCLHSNYFSMFGENYITNDDNVSFIRIATKDEKEKLNKKISENGKCFDKDKCEIMPIVEKCHGLSEDTAQELIRLSQKIRRDALWGYIEILKKEGYKILEKKEAWEEV